jgi:hypothetical protein
MADGLFVEAAADRIPDLLARTAEWLGHGVPQLLLPQVVAALPALR